MSKLGIDCSRWQGNIDWPLLASQGVLWAAIRASVGNYYIDPTFEDNFDGASAAGIMPLSYHVIHPDNDVESQLDRYELAMNGRAPAGLVIDAEIVGTVSENIRKRRTYWIMRKTDDRWPSPVKLYYTASWYWNPNIGATYSGNEFKNFLLWVASYGPNDGQVPPTPPFPDVPNAWKDADPQWWIWQYTSRGVLDGTDSANIDLNLMRDDFYAKLRAKWDGEIDPPPPSGELETRVESLENWKDAVHGTFHQE